MTQEQSQNAPWTVLVLTEEAFSPVDAGNVADFHAEARAGGDELDYHVLVPADTERSVLAGLVDHLSLGEWREALDALRHPRTDEATARADAATALEQTLQALRAEGLTCDGEVVADDPLPALRVALTDRPAVRELVVVTRPHAVEDTFHRDWASRARDTLGIPVLHVYAGTTRLG